MAKVLLNTWYVCNYIDSLELCKITNHRIRVNDNTFVFCYKVVCYYSCNDIYVGTLADCKKWIREHISSRGYISHEAD